MQTNNEESLPTVLTPDYYALLIKLGVPEKFLIPEEIDFDLLYKRLRFVMGDINDKHALHCCESWQVQAIAGFHFDFDTLKNISTLRDNRGASPIHYAAWSGKPEALEWIEANMPTSWFLCDYIHATPTHYAAWSGEPNAISWLLTNKLALWELKDKNKRGLIHYVANSGNRDGLAMIPVTNPEQWMQKDQCQMTAIDFAGISGNAEAFNYALSQSPNPNHLELKRFSKVSEDTFIKTLLETFKTNYSLTSITTTSNTFDVYADVKEKVELFLLRNREIKNVKIGLIVFCQGLLQTQSPIYSLHLDICSVILNHLLPKNVDTSRIYHEIIPRVDKTLRLKERISDALMCVEREIERLNGSCKKNNTFFKISLESIYKSSDLTITALYGVKAILSTEGVNLEKTILVWEKEHESLLTRHRNKLSSICGTELTKSQLFVKKLKSILGITERDYTHQEILAPQEEDGFVLT